MNRLLQIPDVLARTKRHKEKHWIPVKDMINRYREMQMKKARLIKQRTEYIFIIWQTHGLERFHGNGPTRVFLRPEQRKKTVNIVILHSKTTRRS